MRESQKTPRFGFTAFLGWWFERAGELDTKGTTQGAQVLQNRPCRSPKFKTGGGKRIRDCR